MLSARHHYIPKFYINGFVNANGLLYVYDKIKDKIVGEKPPKSIFYEWDRNSIFHQEKKTSILEEESYGYVDRYCAPAFDWFKNYPNIDAIHDLEMLGKLKVFATNLYWRLPVNDGLFEDFWQRTGGKFEATTLDEKFAEYEMNKIKSEDIRKKLVRSHLDVVSINEAIKKSKNETMYNKIFDLGRPKFILGDNPVVYKTQPITIDQIVYSDLAFAISSNRLFFEMSENGITIDNNLANMYNVVVIHQSAQYVCSCDKNLLEQSIEHYKRAKWQHLISYFKYILFKCTS